MMTYAIKLSTSENCPLDTFEEVQEVLRLRKEYMNADNGKTIALKVSEGSATAHIFPEYIVGYVEIHGTSLRDISSNLKILHEIEKDDVELNLYSEKRTA